MEGKHSNENGSHSQEPTRGKHLCTTPTHHHASPLTTRTKKGKVRQTVRKNLSFLPTPSVPHTFVFTFPPPCPPMRHTFALPNTVKFNSCSRKENTLAVSFSDLYPHTSVRRIFAFTSLFPCPPIRHTSALPNSINFLCLPKKE